MVSKVKHDKPPQGAQKPGYFKQSDWDAEMALAKELAEPVNHNFSYDANGSYIDQN